MLDNHLLEGMLADKCDIDSTVMVWPTQKSVSVQFSWENHSFWFGSFFA